jgi:Stage II sporulation protein E (SpoIIE)/CHASE domain
VLGAQPSRGATRNLGLTLFVIPVLATALGLAAAGAIWAREASQARQRDLRDASQVATALARSAGAHVDGLRGASALVADDDDVSDAELKAFAGDLLRDSSIAVVADVVPVTDAERASFEARLGKPIVAVGPSGDVAPEAQRATYLPVIDAVRRDPSITVMIGLDLLSNGDRAKAVAESVARRAPTISAPVSLAPNRRTGYLAVAALPTPTGRVVGYLTASFAIDDVLDAALATLGHRPAVAIYDGAERIAGTLDGGASARVVVGGRTLVVRAEDPTSATLWPALVIAAGALLAGIALALSLRRLRRSEHAASALAEHLAHDRSQAMGLAELGRELTVARSRDDVVTLVEERVPGILGAARASLVFVEGPPPTEAAGTAIVPLLDASGVPFGALDLRWAEHQTIGEADPVRLSTLGALVAGTLQRVDAAVLETERLEHLAAFAQHLAVAATAADVRAVVATDGADLVGADDADCVLVAPSGALEASESDRRRRVVPNGAPALVAAAVDRVLAGGDEVTITDSAGRLTFAALPLRAGQLVRGAMRLAWHEPIDADGRLHTMLRTVADLTGQALVRARATDDSVRHSDGLARLAEELAVATTLDQVASAAADYLPTISDAADVHVATDDEGVATDGERHTLTDTSGDTVGELVVAWPGPASPDAGQRQRLRTAIGLIDDTVRRVDIQRSTSETILSLRQRLLRPLPSPAGLDLAARYRPTSRPLGMGGDWYDVVERRDGTVAIVIGDIVGHGIPAIATMIHVSTILGGLVRSSTAPEDLIAQATAMLDGDGMVATAQILLLDPAASALTMVSAGHPPPLLRTASGRVERLPEATHPPLGVGDGEGPVVRVPFPPGAVLVGYTDGLVERRGEPIDDGIGRLADVLATTDGSVWGAIGSLLPAVTPDGGDRGDDDVAIVVAKHRANDDPCARRPGPATGHIAAERGSVGGAGEAEVAQPPGGDRQHHDSHDRQASDGEPAVRDALPLDPHRHHVDQPDEDPA